jgi:hypothetical protein
LTVIAKLTPEQMILRWLNYHLRYFQSSVYYRALPDDERPLPADYTVSNLDSDLADGKALSAVLHCVAPAHAPADVSALGGSVSADERVKKVLSDAARAGVTRVQLDPSDITTPRPKLLLAFLAELMGTCPGLEPVVDVDVKGLLAGDESAADAREHGSHTVHALAHAHPCALHTVACARACLCLWYRRVSNVATGCG